MSNRLLCTVAVAIGSFLLVGCATKRVANVDPDARAAIGFAATARYPGNAMNSTANVLLAALDYPNQHKLDVLNLSDSAVPDPSLWINGAYVRKLPTIPPRGTVTINYSGVLQAGQTANDFERAGQTVTQVEIQANNGLYRVLGPAVRR